MKNALVATACQYAEGKLKKEESDLAKFKEEAIRSITGEGKLSLEVISTLSSQQEETAAAAKLTYEQAKQRIDDEARNAESQARDVKLIHSWADSFDSATIEHQRMIIASITGDYEIEISLKLDAQQYLFLAS